MSATQGNQHKAMSESEEPSIEEKKTADTRATKSLTYCPAGSTLGGSLISRGKTQDVVW
jgi:hypothetical protein